MTLTEIHEHTCDLSLLPEKALILDIGCLGMEFTNYFRNLGHTVHAVDIQEFEGEYDQIAITDYNGTAFIEQSEDLQATKIGYTYQEGKPQTPCCTLQTYMKIMDVEMFDLIKIDCEGAEHRIIMSLQKPPAKQCSIEFHIHTGIYGMTEVLEMEEKLYSLGYKAVQHEFEDKHCAGFNFWNSLFILQE